MSAAALQVGPSPEPKAKTGPKTPDGRRRSSLNATQHGILSNSDVLPWEDEEEFQVFVAETLDYFQVKHPYERRLVRRLASLQWRLQRLQAFEHALAVQGVVAATIDPVLHSDPPAPEFRANPEEVENELTNGRELYRHLHATFDELHVLCSQAGDSEWVAVPGAQLRALGLSLVAVAEFAKDNATHPELNARHSWTNRVAEARADLEEFMRTTAMGGGPSDFEAERHVPAPLLHGLLRLVRGAAAVFFEHLRFLSDIEGIAAERADLTTGVVLATSTMPRSDELDRLVRYGRFLDRSIREVMAQVEASRRLRHDEGSQRSPLPTHRRGQTDS